MENIQSSLNILRIIFLIVITCALCYLLLIYILGYQERDASYRLNRTAINTDITSIKSFLLNGATIRSELREYLTNRNYSLYESIVSTDIYIKTNSYNNYVAIVYVIDSNINISNNIRKP